MSSSIVRYFTTSLTLFGVRLTRRTTDLLRVIRKGPAVKNTVDEAIDQCAEVFNLRDSIEEARTKAQQASDEKAKKMYAQRGIVSVLKP